MIGQSEMKEAQGWATQAAVCGDTQVCGCDCGHDPERHRAPGGQSGACGGSRCRMWSCTWRRNAQKNSQIWRRAIWVAIISTCTSDFTFYHYVYFFWISQPMHGVSLWRQQNGKKKKKKIDHKKKRNNKCIIGHLSRCRIVFPFWHFMVCETVPHLRLPPPCILTLSTQSHWSLLHKRGRRFLLKWSWIGSPLGAPRGFSGSIVVLCIVLARQKDLLVSAVCSLSVVMCLFFKFPIFMTQF